MDDLQTHTAEMGQSVHKTTISRTLQKSSLYGRVARRKTFLKENHKKAQLEFARSHMGDTDDTYVEQGALVR